MGQETNLTLRQIEIVRAMMITGSITGAARFLNVAQPGVSRALKHIEAGLGISLFIKHGGRLVPAPEAQDIFFQVQEVYDKLKHFNFAMEQLRRGRNVELSIGSVPSIAQIMVPRAISRFREKFPDIKIKIELLKIEEAVDYLMLRRGDVVCMSSQLENASIEFAPLARGTLLCVADRTHPLAQMSAVSVRDIVAHPLIGIDPKDPYGRIMADLFYKQNLTYDIPIQARFGSTVIGLVKQKLGIAVLDSFTVEDIETSHPTLAVIPIREKTSFQTFVARRRDIELSGFSQQFIAILRQLMSASKRPAI